MRRLRTQLSFTSHTLNERERPALTKRKEVFVERHKAKVKLGQSSPASVESLKGATLEREWRRSQDL